MSRSAFVLALLVGAAALARVPAPQDSVAISGDGIQATTLTVADLQKLDHVSVSVHQMDGSDASYEGVEVITVLKKAGLTVADHPGKAMSAYVAVTASDGYEVVFGLGELLPAISGRKVILAYSRDGKPLDVGAGPLKIVVEGDKMQSRSIRMVTSLKLTQLRK